MYKLASLSGLTQTVVDHVGVSGVAAGVFLNGIGVPGLGEVLLPLGGVAVHQGRMNLVVLMVAAMAAQVAGVTVAYYVARYGGLAVIERYGKYVLISKHDLRAAHRASQKYGGLLVLVGSFVPGIQGFVGYIAGLAEMDVRRFLLAATVGKLVWVGGLIAVGYMLGGQLDLIDRSLKQVGVVVLLGFVAFVIWHLGRHRRSADGSGPTATGEEH